MYRFCIIVCFSFLVFSCVKKTISPKASLNKIFVKKKPLPKKIELSVISDSAIQVYLNKHPNFKKYGSDLMEFYTKRQYEYAWFTKEGILPRTDMFLNMMNSSEYKTDLSIDSISTIYSKITVDTSYKNPADSLRQLEIRLSTTFFVYADNEWAGSDEKLVRKLEWYIPKNKLKNNEILDSLLKTNEEELSIFKAPIFNQYYRLKTYLKQYQQMDTLGDWNQIFIVKKKYILGDSSFILPLIKKRLFLLGDLAKNDSTIFFDSTLFVAVKSFQKRHGLAPDGKIGNEVMQEMNGVLSKRIQQMIINMERSKWIPFNIKGEYLAVNIPEFKLHAFNGSEKLWEMNVVVGKNTNKTVIFSGTLQYIVLNPYWVVTHNIFTKEFVPKLRKNPGYLKKQNIELVSAKDYVTLIDPFGVDWSQNGNHYHNFIARQKPGRDNSLGKVKFIFPNQFSIYLHDTPAKALFSQNNRSFSHGCIRVEKPEFLTKFLLKDQPNWTEKTLQKAWSTPFEQYIPLKVKMPVFIAYFTAWVDTDGKLNFRKDIYGHDAKMAKLLFEKPLH